MPWRLIVGRMVGSIIFAVGPNRALAYEQIGIPIARLAALVLTCRWEVSNVSPVVARMLNAQEQRYRRL
jgi:hypothetical protein